MVYNGPQSSFVSLAWPWSGRSLPKVNQRECWDPGQGPNVVRLPVLLPLSNQPKAWQVDILPHGWLAGQLQLASWLTAYQTKCQPYLPQAETSCGHVCDDSGHIDQMYPLVETSHGQVWYYCEQAALWSDVPPPPHETSGLVCIWSDVRSGQHQVRCTLLPHKWKSCLDMERWLPPVDNFYTMKDLLPGRETI